MPDMKPVSRVNAAEGGTQVPRGSASGTAVPEAPRKMLIQLPFQKVYQDLSEDHQPLPWVGYLSPEQRKALSDITYCKTPEAGYSVHECSNCGHTTYNYNKCKNRNCPVCRNLKTMVWVDNRSVDVIDAPYFHVVMTLPHELNELIYVNQKALYGLLHQSLSRAILELSRDEKYLGGTPGIIQVLHTWDQELKYHVHLHAIVTGAGLTKDGNLVYVKSDDFFIPVHVLSKVVRGKFMEKLKDMYEKEALKLTGAASKLKNHYEWQELINKLYSTNWNSYVKATFNGKGNAIEYLARYTNKVGIGNSRIVSVSGSQVVFTARGSDGKQSRKIKISTEEFVGRFLMHVLPSGFQKVRYYGFLANGCRKEKIAKIRSIQGGRTLFQHKYKKPTESEVLRVEFNVDVHTCPKCKIGTMDIIEDVEGFLSHTYTPAGKKKKHRYSNRKSRNKPREAS